MEETQNGVQAWMSSIRASMANDPCRQLFEDQVQTHAFLFLEDYLESIITGPKQGPMIELVKTPGRKKHAPHRTRATPVAAAARVHNIASLSLDDDTSTKENIPPVNSFHKALLLVKEKAVHETSRVPKSPETVSFSHNAAVHERQDGELPKSVIVDDVPEITVAECSAEDPLAGQPLPKLISGHSGQLHREALAPSPLPVIGRKNELSMIAEGDESPERTSANIASPPAVLRRPVQSLSEQDNHVVGEVEVPMIGDDGPETSHCVRDECIPDADNTNVASTNTFRSISLGSVDNHTQPLRSPLPVRDAPTPPLPDTAAFNSAPALTMFVPLNDSPPRTQLHINSASGFPSLPAPSPLRKSMRMLPQEVTGSSVLPSTNPAMPPPLGKRTSWLMKAREAKAMEGSTIRANNHGHLSTAAGSSVIVAPLSSSALKRKSGEMHGSLSHNSHEHEARRVSKAVKVSGSGSAPLIIREKDKAVDHEISTAKAEVAAPVVGSSPTAAVRVTELGEQTMPLNLGQEGFIGQFKRTVEDLGAHGGKNVSKSFDAGGSAAVALAEARAAAEARVAERNKVNINGHDPEVTTAVQSSVSVHEHSAPVQPHSLFSGSSEEPTRRLSLSDLVSSSENRMETDGMVFPLPLVFKSHVTRGDESVSTTPPNSPPSQRNSSVARPIGPVFNRQPHPVFLPPVPALPSTAADPPKEISIRELPGTFSLPASIPLQYATSPAARHDSRLDTQQSAVYDQGNSAWIPPPPSQDTDHTAGVSTQPRENIAVLDDDDSWPLEKLAAAEQGWKPFDFNNVDREDTWTTLPTESQGPTRNLTGDRKTTQQNTPMADALVTDDCEDQNGKNSELSQKGMESPDIDETSVMETTDTEDIAKPGQFTIDHAEKPMAIVRSDSQLSLASVASSSQSHAGFFSQATKLVNSMLGGAKKTKPEVKSLQLAAAAAKKQQEEADKRVQRLKDMEARRQAALTKKAEEEKSRVLDEEKKIKEEGERRKREREENTDKRPLKSTTTVTKKIDEDTTKKRKIAMEAEQKAGKLPPKDKKDNLPSSKLAMAKASLATPATKFATVQKSTQLTTASALVSSAAYNATLNTAPGSSTTKPMMPEAKPFKVVSASLKGKARVKPQEDDVGDKLPSTVIQSQMAARAKAQMEAAKQQTPEVPSETIELPDINSEYSDSEDEDRVRTFDPPDWAQSPELRQALQIQSTVNPDDIFGAIRPLRMEEIFRTRQSRFRARTSSANWSGTDRLTVEEVREYERRMGFQRTSAS